MKLNNVFEKMWKSGLSSSNKLRLQKYANSLNTSTVTLNLFGCFCKIGKLYYPERDYNSKVIGLVHRDVKAKKIAIKGSKRGLLLPVNNMENSCLYITEGASDCFALSWLLKSHRKNKYQVIAKPNKSFDNHELLLYADRVKPKHITICADSDDNADVNKNGTESLACDFECLGYDVDIIKPPNGIKDVRDWIKKNATKTDFVKEKENEEK